MLGDDLAGHDLIFLRRSPLVGHEGVCGLAFEANVGRKHESCLGCLLGLVDADRLGDLFVDNRSVDVASHPSSLAGRQKEVHALNFHAGALAELFCNHIFKRGSPVGCFACRRPFGLPGFLFPEAQGSLVRIESENGGDV